ncbi:tripartite tricarboxylate transporter substrate binding protein [Ancylobacter mangrovi]|uniref:Tripartite tricarboxylate transporter substrate binding protein n=1 Tax=Ancylobacter mangrovi TaxID=2972472 RepID=A0A9X2PDB4_9HYPH|nr:tripartite tricarboxylate transporter substrate binding protein [Ancylobacter mangrovi]MCS0494791.1 tripartite tricarboxylate transporter substrate binding protein [Ancylobacter mangrovi]MCS0502182.1 tripartite tricarboxylate transporter substrate binding protein [Ancylobacter mangrovi]
MLSALILTGAAGRRSSVLLPSVLLRGAAALALATCLTTSLVGTASAQDGFTPKGPVTMIVPFGPGGGSDLMARSMAAGITTVHPDVQVAVENRPGGNGVIGYNYLRQNKGNPQMLLASETAAVALPLLIQPPPFQWTDFTPVAQIAADSQLLVVPYNAPYKGLDDFLAAAKQKKFRVGLTSTTSSDAIVANLLSRSQNVAFQPVVLESGSASVARLLNGDIEFTILNPSETIGQLKAKMLRPLAAFSEVRYPADSPLGSVPTAKEQGVDVSFAQYRGLYAAGGITKDQADYWADTMEAWTKTPAYKDYIAKNNLFPEFRRGDDFKAYLEKTQATLKQALKKD